MESNLLVLYFRLGTLYYYIIIKALYILQYEFFIQIELVGLVNGLTISL